MAYQTCVWPCQPSYVCFEPNDMLGFCVIDPRGGGGGCNDC